MKPKDLVSHELTCPHCQKRLAYVPPIDRFALVHGPDAAQALAATHRYGLACSP